MPRLICCAAAFVISAALSLSAATVDGLKLHSSSSGGGAKTVILVHGWTCDSTSWAEQVPALARDYRVLTLDLPGHGKSEAPRDGKFSMDLFARAVEAVRVEARADKVVLVGHSMGTPVIRQYARLYPQHVAGLVAVDGVIAFAPGPPQPGVPPPPDARQMGGPGGLKAREALIRSMFTPATPQPLQKKILDMMLGAPEATATGAMAATFDPAIWKDDVMTMPVLAVYAEKSQLGNREAAQKVFPKIEYTEIPGTGHFLMMEKPQEFNRLLTAFLQRVTF